MALKHRRKALLGIILGLMAFSAPGYAQSRAAKLPSLYTVGNILAKADAESGVEAKNVAQQKAIVQAFRTLLFRLTDFRVQNRLPEITPQQAGQFVTDIDVRGEGIAATSYVATFSVSFSETGVKQFLSQYGISTIEERAPEITIVPVYIDAGAARTTDRNPWHTALAQLDLAHALVPAKLAPTRTDITAALAKAYLASPAASLQNLKTQYRTGQIVMAVAELEGDDALTVSMIGVDSLGEFTVKRKVKSREGVDDSLIATAARVTFEAIQERWKLTRFSAGVATAEASGAGSGGPAQPGYGGGAPDNGGYTGSGGGASASTVQITAIYSGLNEWRSIRTQLQGLPGVQNWDLKEVTPRNATVSFDFPGGAERWREIASQGLSVESGPSGYVVKTK